MEDTNDEIKKIKKIGFKKIRESQINDIYMTSKLNELNKDNIRYILKKAILLRNLKLENKEINKITYKKSRPS